MENLSFKSKIKGGKYIGKTVNDVVGIKGGIFDMIKEGYSFDDDVLKAAHIQKSIRDVRITYALGGSDAIKDTKPLPKDKTSVKQIISELNTISQRNDNIAEKDERYHSDDDHITIENYNDRNDD